MRMCEKASIVQKCKAKLEFGPEQWIVIKKKTYGIDVIMVTQDVIIWCLNFTSPGSR